MRGAQGGIATVGFLCGELAKSKQHLSESTKKTQDRYKKLLENFIGYSEAAYKTTGLQITQFFSGLDLGVRDNNSFAEYFNSVLEAGVSGGYLSKNPITKEIKKQIRKKLIQKPTQIPTVEEAEKIIENIISKGKPDSEYCAKDYLSFLFLAGIGEAELNALAWENIDWANERINIQRQKTGEYFYVPFFPWLKPFIQDLWERRGKPSKGFIFKIKSLKQGIWNTCKRLKLPKYSPRCFRKACIVRQIRGGMPVDLVAKFQGHRDNGILIQRVYAYVISSNSQNFERQMLNMLENS